MALELPFGIQTVNPIALDFWSGPYSGILTQQAVDAANGTIPSGVRFQSMEVNLLVSGVSYKYWYASGTSNSDLVPFYGGLYDPVNNRINVPSSGIRFGDSTIQTTAYIPGNISISGNYKNVNNDYIASISNDSVLFLDPSLNDININLPSASGAGGKQFYFKRKNGNYFTKINASGTETIDGQPFFEINYNYEAVSIISDNQNWYVF
jgi:hypothetical protein